MQKLTQYRPANIFHLGSLACGDGVKMTPSTNRKSERYDPWYVKVAFGVFPCVLVASLVGLHSSVPVPHFIVAR
jgi:hypothetical protein